MKLTALVQKSVEGDPQAMTAADVAAVKDRKLCGLPESELRRRVVASTRRFFEAE